MYNEEYLAHYGVKGMKWGVKRAKYEYKYQYGQKPKIAYQKALRSLGGTKFAKNAIKISGLNADQKKQALKEQAALADEKAYNKAAKKAHKTGGQVTYDVATGKYSADGGKKLKYDTKKVKDFVEKTLKAMDDDAKRRGNTVSNNFGKVPTIKEQVERANKIGRAPIKAEELERLRRNNI